MKNTVRILSALLLCIVCSASACSKTTTSNSYQAQTTTPAPTQTLQTDVQNTPSTASSDEHELKSHYLNVGQGDCTFIELPNGKTMLIDAGDRGNSQKILDFIHSLGHNKLDYIVISHPHLDHIGSMENVIRGIDVGQIYMPKTDCDTDTYESLLNTILEKGLKIKTAKAGVNILSEDNLSIDILSPNKAYDDLNNSSAVIMLSYGNTKFLYMGDAENDAENAISADVTCDVIKIGHHGSDTSSSKAFINIKNAKYAIISVGIDNSYGHPKESTITAWESIGTKIYRTDKSGDITVSGDGHKIYVEEGSILNTTPSAYSWVLNTSTHKIHKPTCKHVSEIKEGNKLISNKSINELESMGYTACKACKPED